MDLREYSPNTRTRVHKTKPSLRFHTKSGLFTINPAAAALTGFQTGDNVVLLQDKKDLDVWYLSKSKPGHVGFALREYSKKMPGFHFNCSQTARAIANSVGMEKQYGAARIASPPVVDNGRTLWVLITASLKPRTED